MAVKTKKHLVPVESTNLLDQMFNEKCHEVKKLWITRTGHRPSFGEAMLAAAENVSVKLTGFWEK
jgi:hypothetical protein